MSRLAITSLVLGAAIVVARLPGVVAPAEYGAWLRRFPRSVWWGRVLMGIATLWAWIVVYHAATEEWAWTRPLIVVGFPVGYWLVIRFAEQFLAVRGAAALSMLLAKIVLDGADTSELPARLVVTVLTYLWVIVAIWFSIAPHHARDLIAFSTATQRRLRWISGLGVVVGVGLMALGLFVY